MPFARLAARPGSSAATGQPGLVRIGAAGLGQIPGGHSHARLLSSRRLLPLDAVRTIASEYGYTEIGLNEKSVVISFRRDDIRINVYYTTGTVGTCVDHPKQGKTQLFRKNVDLQMLKTIFGNPRVHTDRGYQRKRSDPDRSRGTDKQCLASHQDRAAD